MKPVLYVFGFDFVSKVLMGLAGLLLIRYLPTSEYFLFTIVMAFSTMLVQGISSNMNGLYIAGHKRLGLEDRPQRFLVLQLWFMGFGLLVVAITRSFDTQTIAILISLTVANGLLEFTKTHYQYRQNFLALSLAELLRTLLYIAVLLVFLVPERIPFSAGTVLFVQSLCTAVVVALWFGNKFDWKRFLQFKETLRLGRQIMKSEYRYMIGYFFAVALLLRTDIFMLDRLATDFELVTYGSAFRYFSLILVILTALHTVFLPKTQAVTRSSELRKLFRKHFRIVAFVLPVIFLGGWFSAWIIPWIDGGKYPGAILIFRALCFVAAISICFSPYANVLFRYELYRFLFYLAASACVLNVVLNLFLIPEYRGLGAAIATFVSAGAINVGMFLKSRSLLSTRPLPDNTSLLAKA